MRITVSLILLAALVGCETMQVAELDPATGRFPSSTKATVVTTVDTDLDSMKALLLLPDNDFVKGQIGNIHYFDETMTLDDLEKYVVQNDLQDKIPSVRDKIGINTAYKEYRPFLWLRFDTRMDGNKKFGQFILTHPETLEDLFVVEKHFDYTWAGVNDQNTWYPMFNAIVDYIDENSQTWAPPSTAVAR